MRRIPHASVLRPSAALLVSLLAVSPDGIRAQAASDDDKAGAAPEQAPQAAPAQAPVPDGEPPPTDVLYVEVVASAREIQDYSAIDTGRSVLTESTIGILAPGGGDPNALLELLANVQFDRGRDRATNATLQDIAPAQVSISGGRTYENTFILDGIATNSVMDSVSDNPNDFNEVIGHPQTIYLETSLLEEAAVYDSNVSAEYTGFTGGVVAYDVRDPRPRPSFSAGWSYTSDRWTNFIVDDDVRTDPLPATPDFRQESWNFRADVPINERWKSLLSFARNIATVNKAPDQSLFGDTVTTSVSRKDNYLAKLTYALSDAVQLTFSGLYTPYEREFQRFDKDLFNGGGLNTFVEWDQVLDDGSLTVKVGYNDSDSGRESAPEFFIYANTASTDWVPDSARSAQRGGFGDLLSRQRDGQLSITRVLEMDAAQARFGLQAGRIQAHRSRPENNRTYRNGRILGTTLVDGSEVRRVVVGASGNDPSIIEGEQVLTQRIDYLAHAATVHVNNLGLWGEYDRKWDLGDHLTLRLRGGGRYDHDDFLANHNFAPRVSAVLGLPKGIDFTVGANRYYSDNLVAYKLREAYPDEFVYERIPTITNELNDDLTGLRRVETYSGAWTLRAQNRSIRFGQADVDTPYSDEMTAAITAPVARVGGQVRAKWVSRRARDEFVRGEGVPTTFTREDGSTGTYTRYPISNGGSTDYDGFTLEYQRSFGSGLVFDTNATWSETTNNGATGFLSLTNDGLDRDTEEVFFADTGEIVQYGALSLIRDNFATPLIVNANVTAAFFRKRLTANLNFRYRASYDEIAALTDRTINPDGTSFVRNRTVTIGGDTYEVYGTIQEPDSLRLNLNLRATLGTVGDRRYIAEVRIRNLTEDLPNAGATVANPYERGRSFWFEFKVEF